MRPIDAIRFAMNEDKMFDARPITAINITEELWLRILADVPGSDALPVSTFDDGNKKLFGVPVNIVLTEDHPLFDHVTL